MTSGEPPTCTLLNYKEPITVHISCVPAGANPAEFPPRIIGFPFDATNETVVMSELIVLTAVYATSTALETDGWYGVTWTDTIDVNSAAPVELPSTVGYAVATPEEPVTCTVPNQVPTITEAGAPAAAEENVLDPL